MQIYKKTNFWAIIWLVSIALSIAIRIPGLKALSFLWRPVQTEMTAYWFAREGIDLLRYQTPMYGPPWRIPLEFPLFQAIAALISWAGLGIEFASRLTALICFYLSALFLYLICRRIFEDHLTTFIILMLYLWMPYNIYYSTEPLIDYLALALALAYLLSILLWLEMRSSFVYASLGVFFGSLGFLVKPTTMPVIAAPVIAFVINDIYSLYRDDIKRLFDLRLVLKNIWPQRAYWLTLFIVTVIPLLIGSAWTSYSDRVKEASIFTAWLTSEALVHWNFGTWELRINWEIWSKYLSVAQESFLPYGLLFFVLLYIFFVPVQALLFNASSEEKRSRIFVFSILAGIFVVLVIFLNLYRHHYYYIALSASMSILGGYGIVWFWNMSRKRKTQPVFFLIFAIWMIYFFSGNINSYEKYRDMIIVDTNRMEQMQAWARQVQQYVPSDKWIVVVESDWNPTYIYPLERRAMVVSLKEKGKPVCRLLSDERFVLVVIQVDKPKMESRIRQILEHVLGCFKSYQEVMPGVYQIIR